MTKLTKIIRPNDINSNLLVDLEEGGNIPITLNTDSTLATQFLMERLIELYPDPVLATIRETISNSYDAISNQSVKRIEIIKPSQLEPNFIVKDSGVGMSKEDIINVYSKFGASTKGEDLDSIGAYGLGAKAPLSYCDSFTVDTIKDGERTMVLVSREADGNYMKVILNEETNEPSGTTINIPVEERDINYFIKLINNYKKYPITIEGLELIIEDCEDFSNDYLKVSGKLEVQEGVFTDYYVRKDCILSTLMNDGNYHDRVGHLIGGFCYNTVSDFVYSIVVLPIGLVDFTSSRDSIKNNHRYKEYNARLNAYFLEGKGANDILDTIDALDEEERLSIYSYLYREGALRSNDDGVYLINYDKEVLFEERMDKIRKEVGEIKPHNVDDILILDGYGWTGSHSRYMLSREYGSGQKFMGSTDCTISVINNITLDMIEQGEETRKGDSYLLAHYLYATSPEEKIAVIHLNQTPTIEDDYKKIKNRRKLMFEIIEDEEDANKVIYTSLTEKEFNLLLLDNHLPLPTITHYTASEMAEMIREEERKRRKSTSKKTNNLIKKYSFYKVGEGYKGHIKVKSDFSQVKKNDLVLTRQYLCNTTYINKSIITTKKAYCINQGLDEKEVDLFVCSGKMRVDEFKELEATGCVIKEEEGHSLSNAKFYKDTIEKHKKISLEYPHTRMENLKTKEDIMRRLILDFVLGFPHPSSEKLERPLKSLIGWCKTTNYRVEEMEVIEEAYRERGKPEEALYNKESLIRELIAEDGTIVRLGVVDEKELLSNLSKAQKKLVEEINLLYFSGQRSLRSEVTSLYTSSQIKEDFKEEEKEAKKEVYPTSLWDIQKARRTLKLLADKTIKTYNLMNKINE